MNDLTEEAYDALDELWTHNPPQVSGDGTSGFFMRHRGEIVLLDRVSATWVRAKAEADRITSTEVISRLVREKIAATAV
jgi:hypothetical protein